MSERDSSRTRVAPVFDRLRCIDPSGRSWLPTLLSLPTGLPRAPIAPPSGKLLDARWWPHEKRLPAPRALLEWLIQSATAPESAAAWGKAATRSRREALIRRDQATTAEALKLLAASTDNRAWYVLEGPTCPDVFLETADSVIVIEGKRTEGGPTTHTSWMSVRHQMLRHLDAALEICNGRRLNGFFIVESSSREVPSNWREAGTRTVSEDALVRSLPHRSNEERARIADAFLGVTTWEAVRGALSIPEAVLIEKVAP